MLAARRQSFLLLFGGVLVFVALLVLYEGYRVTNLCPSVQCLPEEEGPSFATMIPTSPPPSPPTGGDPKQEPLPPTAEAQNQELPTVDRKGSLKIAYLLLVHSKDSVLASWPLLNAIWRPQFFFLFVIDKNADNKTRTLLKHLIAERPTFSANVRMRIGNVNSKWGSMGLVQNELDGLQHLMTLGQWDFAINLSGDTFPLMSQEQLLDTLHHWQGHNFVTDDGKTPLRGNQVPSHKAKRMRNVKWPTGITSSDHFGSQWFVLTREFVEYMLTSSLSRNVLVAMSEGKAGIPDESFMQVLIMNSPFNHTVGQPNLNSAPSIKPICRFIKWDRCNYTKPGFPRMFPCFLGINNLEEVIRSGCIFARKLHLDVSGELYMQLEQRVAPKKKHEA